MSYDKQKFGKHADQLVVWAATLTPVGIVAGNIAFEFLTILTCISWLLRHFIDNSVQRISIKESLILVFAATYSSIIISSILNYSNIYNLLHDAANIRNILFIIAIIDVAKRQDISKHLIFGLALGIIFAAINNASAHIFGQDMFGHELARYNSKLKEAARISALSAYTGPCFLLWALLSFKQNKWRYTFICLSISTLSFILLANLEIRTTIIAAIGGTIIALIFYLTKRKYQLLIMLSGAMACLFYILYVAPEKFQNLSSLYARFFIWKASWELWVQNLGFGVGVANFRDAYHILVDSGSVTPFSAPNDVTYILKTATHPHNIILDILSRLGIVGLTSFTLLVFYTARVILRNNNNIKPGLISIPIVFSIISLTGWSIFDSFYRALTSYLFAVLIIQSTSPDYALRKSKDDCP